MFGWILIYSTKQETGEVAGEKNIFNKIVGLGFFFFEIFIICVFFF